MIKSVYVLDLHMAIILQLTLWEIQRHYQPNPQIHRTRLSAGTTPNLVPHLTKVFSPRDTEAQSSGGRGFPCKNLKAVAQGKDLVL